MTEKLTTYDPASALVDDEEIAFFMADAFETGDAAYIAKALGIVARAKGMAEIASGTIAALVPIDVPTIKRVKGMVAIIKITKGIERPTLTMTFKIS